MTPALLQTLNSLRPEIKSEWGQLLNGEPTITPLGRPDTLVYLMDATLEQLTAGLDSAGAGAQWLRHCEPVVGSVHRYCACGLNPLLKYFTTGELALHAAAGSALGPHLEEVLSRFQALARQEIQTLCSVCQHKHVPHHCELPGSTHPHVPDSARR